MKGFVYYLKNIRYLFFLQKGLLVLTGVFTLLLFSCNSSKIEKQPLHATQESITITQILDNPYLWQGKTVKLTVSVGGNCWNVKRQGCICVTDGTASLCAEGKLPREIPTRPWKNIPTDIKNKKFWIKGIIKIYSSRQLIGKADNVFGGKPVYGKTEYAPGRYKTIVSLKNAKVVYIWVSDSDWVR